MNTCKPWCSGGLNLGPTLHICTTSPVDGGDDFHNTQLLSLIHI